MMDYKIIISIVAVVLAFVGYAPYILDVLKKKTTPHMFTWLVWTLAVGISCALQISGGAGVGAWVSVAITFLCFIILVLSFWNGHKDITSSDIFFLILAFTALFLWIVVKQPVLSVILIVSTDVLGFIPTVRKSWNKPYSETLSTYEISTVRHGLSIFALQQFNILTLFYPIVWTAANALFGIFLIVRRRQIHSPTEVGK